MGTPLDTEGNLCVESYKKQIDDQIQAGAIGILSMGSMGQQAFIRGSVYPQVARAAVEAAAGRVPVYVGAMDCSIGRARERMDSVESLNLDIAGFVFTTPYYHSCSRDQMVNYFTAVGAAARRPVLLYDLPGVTQSKITCDLVLELIRKIPNLTGIKSNDTHMFRRLKLCGEAPESFAIWTIRRPIVPPPTTNTVCPGRIPAWSMPWITQARGSAIAASSKEMSSLTLKH